MRNREVIEREMYRAREDLESNLAELKHVVANKVDVKARARVAVERGKIKAVEALERGEDKARELYARGKAGAADLRKRGSPFPPCSTIPFMSGFPYRRTSSGRPFRDGWLASQTRPSPWSTP